MKVSKTLLNVICPFTKVPGSTCERTTLLHGDQFGFQVASKPAKFVNHPVRPYLPMTSTDNPDIEVRVHENH